MIIILAIVELLNLIRYRRFSEQITHTGQYVDNMRKYIFQDIYCDKLNSYSRFMKHFIKNELIIKLYATYYPDAIISKKRISFIIKKYLFDINENNYINISKKMIDVHSIINYFTKKISSNYITDEDYDHDHNDYNLSNNGMIDPTDLSNSVKRTHPLKIMTKYFYNMRFRLYMHNNNYKYRDISSSIRIWTKINGYNNDEISFVFLDDSDIEHEYVKCNDINEVYIEIKGLSSYALLFDLLTVDIFNDYDNIEKIGENFSIIIDLFKNHKINIRAHDLGTILIVPIIKYYHEFINKVYAQDPIFYPYAYYALFDNIKNDNLLIKENYNLIKMFNRLSLIDLYFDKNINTYDEYYIIFFSNKMNITFTNSADKFINKEQLAMMLTLYSHVRITKDNTNT
jgi:hypothetical protein